MIISFGFSRPLTGPADLTGFVCSGVASAPLSEDVFPSLTAEEPVRSRERRSVPVSVRWYPRPGCYPALIKMPRRSFRHVVATGGDNTRVIQKIRSCDTLTNHSNTDDVMPMFS